MSGSSLAGDGGLLVWALTHSVHAAEQQLPTSSITTKQASELPLLKDKLTLLEIRYPKMQTFHTQHILSRTLIPQFYKFNPFEFRTSRQSYKYRVQLASPSWTKPMTLNTKPKPSSPLHETNTQDLDILNRWPETRSLNHAPWFESARAQCGDALSPSAEPLSA